MTTKSLLHSSLLDNQYYTSMLVGNDAYDPFFSDYELLATATVASTESSISFTSLDTAYSADYQHLQFRFVARANSAGTNTRVVYQINGGSGTHAWQGLAWNGSSAYHETITSSSYGFACRLPAANATANSFGVGSMDVLNPFDTSKNTSTRGFVSNPQIDAGLWSNVWLSNDAVSSITFTDWGAGSFVAGTRIALYGFRKA